MRVRWLGVGLVAVLVVCTLLLKSRTRHNATSETVNGNPAVVLVADLREADDPHDRCAEIIRAVREASKRGIRVAELPPDSNSDLLRRYHVLTVPTVLLLDASGKEIGRFEGEDSTTVKAVQTRLSALTESKQ
jgi:hypothetical protein